MKLAYVFGTEETVSNVLGATGETENTLSQLKDCGYGAIELFVRDPNKIDVKKLEKLISNIDFEVAAVGTGPVASDDHLKFTDPNRNTRLAAVKRIKDMIKFASIFDAPINIGKLRGDIDSSRSEQSWDHMVECFREVCFFAEKYGVKIMIEPQNRKNINNINSTQEALHFIEKVKIPNLYLMLDTYHMSFEDQPLTESFLKARHILTHIHLADSDRMAPGLGEFDFVTILKALSSIQYNNFISLEVSCKEDRFQEARDAVRYLSSILREIKNIC